MQAAVLLATASIDDANDTTHDATLMRRYLCLLLRPAVTADPLASAESTGRTDLVLCMERDLAASPAGDVSALLAFSHRWCAF